MTDQLYIKLSISIERGKASRETPYPPDMDGQDGASEITQQLLTNGASAQDILHKGLMKGMNAIGEKFSQGKAFIPELLIAAQAMNASMIHLKPFFSDGSAVHRGTFILGTVQGDLHDIGKNIVRMVLEGDGWNVIDLGVDVKTRQFIDSLEKYPEAWIGMSALLTTTMTNMQSSVKEIKKNYPQTKIFIGGAPLTPEFSDKIGSDGYFPDPHSLVKYLSGF